MLSDEEINKNCGVIETIIDLSDHELKIKLKAMEETEKRMIEKFRNNLKEMKGFEGANLFLKEEIRKIIVKLDIEFNEKWFK